MDDISHVYNLHVTLNGELGVKELSAMIVRKGERPVGKKEDFVRQVSALWAVQSYYYCSLTYWLASCMYIASI